jgi:hypothetical protein
MDKTPEELRGIIRQLRITAHNNNATWAQERKNFADAIHQLTLRKADHANDFGLV